MLLSALLVANMSACNYATNYNIQEEWQESTTVNTKKLYTGNESESESITDAKPQMIAEGTIACNGVYRNSKVKYAINQNQELILGIEDWNESFVVPKEDMYFVGETLHSSSVILGEAQGALVFGDFSLPAKPIKVIRFAKGNPQVTVENLTFETSENYSFKYCNFIDEQTGYLFLFNGNYTLMDLELTKMLKTTNGGETWIEQTLEATPSVRIKEDIICAKMLDENVGLIAGWHYADDCFSSKTYITTDGGATWNSIVLPPNDYYTWGDSSSQATYIPSGEAYDFIYKDGLYILCLRQKQENDFVYFKYASRDLATWSFVES